MMATKTYTLIQKSEIGFKCMMTLERARVHRDEIVKAMDAKWPDGWGICVLDGGKVSGGAYGGEIEVGDFYNSDSIGYVVMETYVPGRFELVSKTEPYAIYKTLASREYAEENHDEIVMAMDTKWPSGWGICILEGGRISGGSYGGRIEALAEPSPDIGFGVMVKWDGSFDIVPIETIGHKHLMASEEVNKRQSEIVQSMDAKWPAGWGICVLDGGKISGGSYGGGIELGDFLENKDIGWAVVSNYF